MEVELIDGGSKAECARAIDALTLAFVADPVMRWMYPAPGDYLEHFPAFAHAFGGESFAAGTAWLAEGGGGAALWLPSGVHADGDAIAEAIFGTIDEARHSDMEPVLSRMDALHPEEPHWYLPIIGVDAACQGRGLGAKLMQTALERCDADGLIAYLESSNPTNIPLYQRHGFEIVEEIRVGEVPVVTPMLRPAR